MSADSISSSGKRRFRPSWLLTLAAVLLMLLTARLAVWQFDRAEQKAALEQTARDSLRAAPLPLYADSVLGPYQRAAATGEYLPERQILIDNKVRHKIPGVHVITPLMLKDGGAIAVNRGWVRKDADIPPPPRGQLTVHGVLQKDNADAFVLSAQTEQDGVWQNLDLQKYAASANLPLVSLVLLAEDNAGGLPPATVRVNFKSQQSIGYAWQWLTFCFLTLVFYIILGMRRGARD